MSRVTQDGSMKQERAHPRVPIDAFARAIDGDREYAFRTHDVSEGGLFLSTRVGHLYPFAVGDLLELELHHEERVLVLTGQIVRVADEPETTTYRQGFGVRLTIDDDERTALRELIAANAR